MKKITYLIPSIHCMHCAHSIKMELGEIPGIQSVDVDIQQKTVAIEYDEITNEEKIISILQEINYPPQLEK